MIAWSFCVSGLAIRFDANAGVQQKQIDHPEWFEPNVINALAKITRDRSHQMDTVADLAEAYSFDEVRVAHEQNLVFAHVKKTALYDLWLELRKFGLATPNINLIGDIIACPGLDGVKEAKVTFEIAMANG